MTLLLTLEHGPRGQSVNQARLDEGELVIGRSAEADWQIVDPDMYVSRAHCTISARADGYFVTDTSSSGLFIDDGASPLGTGNSTRLRSGMRLRLGDYVVSVEVSGGAAAAPAADRTEAPARPAAARAAAVFSQDDFFAVQEQEAPAPPRPSGLPDPFEKSHPSSFQGFERADADRHNSPAFDDPFSLEAIATPEDEQERQPAADDLGNDPFGFDAPIAAQSIAAEEPVSQPAFGFDIGFDTGPLVAEPQSPAPLARQPQPTLPPPPLNDVAEFAPWELPATPQEPPAPARPVEPAPLPRPAEATPAAPEPSPFEPIAAAEPIAARDMPAIGRARPMPRAADLLLPRADELPAASAAPAAEDAELRAAFFRGLGVAETSSGDGDAAAEMEKFGREYRLMMEGLMQLLRKRAEEKGNARVAQTVVGASDVNPLKFMPTVEDALGIVMRARSPGFLGGEEAIGDTVRDLAQHHVRAWRGVQAALRRMVDRFDPVALEEELKSSSALGTLLTGGKGAKLWELYRKRHREIAQSAETRFLGEIGADFREAYEEE